MGQYFSGFWPFAVNRKNVANQSTTTSEDRNIEHSLIYRLPAELVLDIVDQLKPVDAHCLRFASRRSTVLLQSIPKVSRVDRERLNDRLERDIYFKRAETEPPDIEKPKTALCSSCRMTHPHSKFTPSQIQLSPHMRKCKGATQSFHLCSHLVLTIDQLKAYKYSHPPIFCLCEGINRGMICDYNLPRNDYSFRCTGRVQSHKIIGYHVSWSDDLIRTVIQQSMKSVERYICPHMTSGDDYVESMMLTGPTTIFDETTVPEEGCSGPGIPTLHIPCPAKECDTVLIISRFSNYIDAQFVRRLGDLKDATHPTWFAQLEYLYEAE